MSYAWPLRCTASLPRLPTRSHDPICRPTPRHRLARLWFNLEVSARRYPDKPAYLFIGQPLRFSALQAQAEALAGWLQAHGVAKGDRVAVFMQNCPQFVVAVHAALRADAVVVTVNPMNKANGLGHCITDPGTKGVLTTADLAAVVAEAAARLPAEQRLRHIVATRFTDAMPAELDPAETPNPALLQWLLTDPALPAGTVRWTGALDRCAGRRPPARPAHRRARQPGAAAPTPAVPPACPRAACSATAR